MKLAEKDNLDEASSDNAFRRVGYVLKPHGVRGAFVLFLESDFPDWLAKQRVLYVASETGMQPWRISAARQHKNTLILTVDALTDRNQCEAARGTVLFVPEEEARAVNEDPDYFFNSDLVGLVVVDSRSGIEYGEIVEVVPSPGQDLLKIKPKSGAPFLFPFSNALVTSIEIDAKRITVSMPEGLTDLN